MTQRLGHVRTVMSSAVVMALLAAPAAWAQQPAPQQPLPPADTQFAPLPPEREGLTLTPFLGIAFSGDLESSPAAFGVALGYGANERVSLETELGIARGGTQGSPIEWDSNLWTFSANVLYHFAQPNFTPYITGGVGVLGGSDPPPALFPGLEINSTTFAWNIGTGIKTALTDHFGIRVDLRHFNGADEAPDHFRFYGGLIIRRIGQW